MVEAVFRRHRPRLPIRYEDPQVADDTDQEIALYDEQSRQICREMLYMMSSA